MSPQELLILLHNMEGSVGLKRCSEGNIFIFIYIIVINLLFNNQF